MLGTLHLAGTIGAADGLAESAICGCAFASTPSDKSEDSDGEKSPSRSARSQVVLCWRAEQDAEQVTVCARLRLVSSGRPRSDSMSWPLRKLRASMTSVGTGAAEEADAALS